MCDLVMDSERRRRERGRGKERGRTKKGAKTPRTLVSIFSLRHCFVPLIQRSSSHVHPTAHLTQTPQRRGRRRTFVGGLVKPSLSFLFSLSLSLSLSQSPLYMNDALMFLSSVIFSYSTHHTHIHKPKRENENEGSV
jgi:hypothetical protein